MYAGLLQYRLHNLFVQFFLFVLYLEMQPWEDFKIHAEWAFIMAEVGGLLVMKIENVNVSLTSPVSAQVLRTQDLASMRSHLAEARD